MPICRRFFRLLLSNSRGPAQLILVNTLNKTTAPRWFSSEHSDGAPPSEPRQFYRRPLPASCIAFASSEGRQLFKEGLEMGFLESFFDLVPQLRTQFISDQQASPTQLADPRNFLFVQPSYCGLSAMVMVLNSFEVDPGRIWKAPWRWYHEDMLTCCLSNEDLFTNGITIDQFQSIAKCNGLYVDCHQPTCSTEALEAFRSCLLSLCSQSLSTSATILVVSYDRKAVNQTGSGHYTLVGGYHPKRDLILVLETAAFKYPMHWAPLTAIYNGMCSLDKVTGKPRGYMLIRKAFDSRTGLITSSFSHDSEVVTKATGEPLMEENEHSAASDKLSSSLALANINQLLNRLSLFCFTDAAFQAFSSPSSLRDPTSAGGRLRALTDEWCSYLATTSQDSLGKTCCCLLQPRDQDQYLGPAHCSPIISPQSPHRSGPAHRCDCPCLIDTLFDKLLALLVKHRPPGFFFGCQPLWPDSRPDVPPATDTAAQRIFVANCTEERRSNALNLFGHELYRGVLSSSIIIFELVSSATGRRARLALERLPQRSYEWLTTDICGALSYRPGSSLTLGYGVHSAGRGSPSPRQPACVLPLIADPKIRATTLLTAFLLAFPHQGIPRHPQPKGENATGRMFIERLDSSEYLIQELPHLSGQTCFTVLTPCTRNELTTLSNILGQLVAIRRPLGTRCIDKKNG
ncbi:hypothetical protein Aperf_G00000094493 [Anoplocephala perfoliata]